MVRKCFFKLCQNSKEKSNISFFNFPKDSSQCRIWAIKCGLSDIDSYTDEDLRKKIRFSKICEELFENNFISKYKNFNRLKEKAIPSDHLILKFHSKGKIQSNYVHQAIQVLSSPPKYLLLTEDRSRRRFPTCEEVVITITEEEDTTSHSGSSLCSEVNIEVKETIFNTIPYAVLKSKHVKINGDPLECRQKDVGSHEEIAPIFLNKSTSNATAVMEIDINAATETLPSEHKDTGTSKLTIRDTPRKIKLKKELCRKRASVYHYKKRLERCKKKQVTEKQVLDFCKGVMDSNSYEILKIQLALSHKKFVHYSPKAKQIALTLYFKGASFYRLIRKFIKLPNKRTVRLWMSKIRIAPGVCPDLFSLLKLKTSQMTEMDKVCVLYMDEMSLKKGFQFRNETVQGFIDYGSGIREPNLANSVLILMIRGLKTNWKQAISYVFTENAIKDSKIKSLLQNVLTELEDCGLNIVAITTDQGSNFQKKFRVHGVTVDKPYLMHNGNKIFVLADVPHLLKSTRNILQNKKTISTDEGTVSWGHIRTAYDVKQNCNFPLIPKIGYRHIELEPFGGKMKVSLAAQVLSNSMSVAISTMMLMEPPYNISTKAFATAEFCRKINDLFDILNSSQVSALSPYKKGLTVDSQSYNFLEESYEWITKWKVQNDKGKNVTNTLKCIRGWLQDINAVKQLIKLLTDEKEWKGLLTRRLCQDGLENFNASIRRKGGLRDHPDCQQFEESFKVVCYSDLMIQSKAASCVKDEGNILLDLSELNKKLNVECHSNLNDSLFSENNDLMEQSIEHNVDEVIASDRVFFKTTDASLLIEKNGMIYVSGYLAFRLKKHHPDCKICNICVLEKNYKGNDMTFLMLKNFSPDPKMGLAQSTDEFHNYFVKCEELFCKIFSKHYYERDIGKRLKKNLRSINTGSFSFCCNRIKMFFINLFVKMRINFILKFKNKDAMACRLKAQQRKKRKVM